MRTGARLWVSGAIGLAAFAGVSGPGVRAVPAAAAATGPASAAGRAAHAHGGQDAGAGTALSELDRLIARGLYVEAETTGLKRVAALDAQAGAVALEIAETLDRVLDARRLGRRLTQPGTVDLAERALRIKEDTFGPDHPRTATTLVLLGLARSAHRNPDGAQAALTRALAIRERTVGPDHLDTAAALNALAWIERIATRFPAAGAAAERALAIARRAEHPPGRETSEALTMLGLVARQDGEPERAVRIFEEVVAIDERLHGPTHPILVSSLVPLGAAYWDVGDADRARAHRERAIQLLEATPGSAYRLAFELLMDSAWTEVTGDYAVTFRQAERAVAVAEKATGPRSPLSAAALDALALAHTRLGDHAAAAAIREKTVALWTAAQGPQGLHTATALKGLAESYEAAGRIDEGFTVIDRAIAVPAMTKEPIVFAQALQVKARLLSMRGRLSEAREVLEQARQVSESSTFAPTRVDLATTLVLLARLERQDGHPSRALPLYRDAIRRFEETLGLTNPSAASWRTEYASALAETGDYEEARRVLVGAEEKSVSHLRLVSRTLTDRAALAFAAQRVSGVDLAVTLATAPPPIRTRADIDRAWTMLIRGRTIVLDEMAARQRTVAAEAEDDEVRERWAALNQARARLANLIVRGPQDQPVERYEALVERTRAARDTAERHLAEASVAFRREQERTRAGLREVIARLPAGSAVVSYVRYTPQRLAPAGAKTAPVVNAQTSANGGTGARAHEKANVSASASATASADTAAAAYAAFVARTGQPVQAVALGPAERIEAAIASWRQQIRDELSSGGLASRRTETAYREAGGALRALIWDAVRPHLGAGTTRAFVVPDGAIHLVDLSTLPTGRTGYLVDAPIVLHHLLAERDLVQPPPVPTTESLLALGAPDFETADRGAAAAAMSPSGRAAITPQNPTTALSPAGANAQAPAAQMQHGASIPPLRGGGPSACEASLPSQFDPLPATRDEVQHIAQLWRRGTGAGAQVPNETGVVLLGGARATEAAFKSLARGRRVLHLATHGFFLERFCSAPSAGAGSSGQRVFEESPLLRSGLVLAGANQRAGMGTDDEDGVLTAEEIAGLDLSGAQWAVLSACDTGRGDWQAGEGVLGLRRAFEVAGARTVILSLWPVIDTVASAWMTELYRGKFVRGSTTATAVRAANRALLADRRAKRLSTHPLYWSGFIATGDWR